MVDYRERVERYLDVLNAHDVARIPATYTEDVVFEDDAWPEPLHGHAGMERFLSTLWRAVPDQRFTLLEGPYPSQDGATLAVRVRVTGRVTGPLDPPGFAATNGPLDVEFAGFYEWAPDGRIRRGRVIVDMGKVAVQIGAAPPPGSPGEKLAVVLQRLGAAWMRRKAVPEPMTKEEALAMEGTGWDGDLDEIKGHKVPPKIS